MAEPLGLAASVITVIETIKHLRKLSGNVKAFIHANEAVKDVTEDIFIAKTFLASVKAENLVSDGAYPRPAKQLVRLTIRPIEAKLAHLDVLLSGLVRGVRPNGTPKVDRIQWLQRKREIKEHLQGLQIGISRLGHAASLLTMTSVISSTKQPSDHPRLSYSNGKNNRVLAPRQTPSTLMTKGPRVRLNLETTNTNGIPTTNSTNSFMYFLGALLISLSSTKSHGSNPAWTICQQHTVIYYFNIFLPAWLTARAIVGSILCDPCKGLELRHLRFPCVRPLTDPIFTYVMKGDMDHIIAAFTSRPPMASPWDVDPDGHSILWYSLSAFNANMQALSTLLLREGAQPLFDDVNNSKRLLTTFRYAHRLIVNEEVDRLHYWRLCLFFNLPSPSVSDYPLVELGDSESKSEQKHGSVIQSFEDFRPYHSRRIPSDFSIKFFTTGIRPCITGNTHVIEAVLHNNVRALEVLLSGNVLPDVQLTLNAQNEFGLAAIHYAVYYNHPRCLELLLKAHADCSLRSHKGHNILHFAAAQADVKTLETLAEAARLENAEKVATPGIDQLYLRKLRDRTEQHRWLNEREWDVWERLWTIWKRLVRRFGKREDNTWDTVMPELCAFARLGKIAEE